MNEKERLEEYRAKEVMRRPRIEQPQFPGKIKDALNDEPIETIKRAADPIVDQMYLSKEEKACLSSLAKAIFVPAFILVLIGSCCYFFGVLLQNWLNL